MGTHPIFESNFDCLTENDSFSCSIARGFALRSLSIGPRQGQKLSKSNLILQKRFNVGINETKLSKSTVCLILASVWGGLYAMYTHSENYKEEQKRIEREQAQWSNANNVDIGKGDWTLIDCKTEKVITKKDLHGKWVLMYFGFSHCPDICPETMEKIMDIIDIHKVEQKKDSSLPDIQPVFISIDPDRDTPEALAYYLEDYPHFLGLTGSMAQVKSVCKNYRIYFTKGPQSDDGDYIVDHSIIIYLINPNSVYMDHFMDRKMSPADLYPVIRQKFKLFDKFNQ